MASSKPDDEAPQTCRHRLGDALHPLVMPRAPSDLEQIAIRLPKRLLARADKAARILRRQPGRIGLTTRTDVIREAVERGLLSIEEGLTPS